MLKIPFGEYWKVSLAFPGSKNGVGIGDGGEVIVPPIAGGEVAGGDAKLLTAYAYQFVGSGTGDVTTMMPCAYGNTDGEGDGPGGGYASETPIPGGMVHATLGVGTGVGVAVFAAE